MMKSGRITWTFVHSPRSTVSGWWGRGGDFPWSGAISARSSTSGAKEKGETHLMESKGPEKHTTRERHECRTRAASTSIQQGSLTWPSSRRSAATAIHPFQVHFGYLAHDSIEPWVDLSRGLYALRICMWSAWWPMSYVHSFDISSM